MTDTKDMEARVRQFADRLMESAGDGLRAHLYSNFISCDPVAKKLTMAYDLTEWSANYRGVTHGGMTASVFDQCMGVLAFWCAGDMVCQTVAMQLTYLKPVPKNCRLIIESTCTSAGRTLENFTAKAWVEGSDAIVATATSTYYCKAAK